MLENNTRIIGNWFDIDFHVHSPSSHDFVGVGNDENGYVWLIEQAKKANLDVIVITDHNDIGGFQKINEIKNEVLNTKKVFNRKHVQLPDDIKNQVDCFESVVVLPGVELDVYPNCHLLILFDPAKFDEISGFLDRAGYTNEVRGKELSSKNGNWNVEQTLKEAENINAIVIASHVDSNKGLYTETKNWGQKRISMFTDENLFGMEFLNPITRDKLEKDIFASPDYARKSRIAFVQSSDFHGKPENPIGSKRTYVRVDGVQKNDISEVFQSIKRALRNPDEFISAPERPELQVILKKLQDRPSIETLDKDEEKLLQFVCAFSNSEDGTVSIGKNNEGHWVGVKAENENEITEKITKLIAESIYPKPIISCQVYAYFGEKYVASVHVKKNNRLCSITRDDSVYILEQAIPRKACLKEIIDVVEGRFIDRYKQLSISEKISFYSKKLTGIEDSIDILPIVRKIDNNSLLLKNFSNPFKITDTITRLDLEKIRFPGNGFSEGNIILTNSTPPRYSDSYVRYSAPKGVCDDTLIISLELQKYSGNKILVIPGGAVYLDCQDNISITGVNAPPLLVTFPDNEDLNLIKYIFAFLKSSVAIWYSGRCLKSFDLRFQSILSKFPIPDFSTKSPSNEIVDSVDTILNYETEFLQKENEFYKIHNEEEILKNEDLQKERLSLVNVHNTRVKPYAKKIDDYFYGMLNISCEEQEIIKKTLKTNEMESFCEEHGLSPSM